LHVVVLCADKLLLEDVVVDGLTTGVLERFIIRLFIRVIRTVFMIDIIRAATPMHIATIARTNDAIVMPVCGGAASPLNKPIIY